MTRPRVTPLYLTWLNPMGGFDYFLFLAYKEFQVNIKGSGTTKKNVFPEWPKSWGDFADTIETKTYTDAETVIFITSQFLTEEQRDALVYIKTSPVVQIVESRTDRRTVLVDTDSFKIYEESEKQWIFKCKLTYTNQITTQRL